jgi:hypothetical protein
MPGNAQKWGSEFNPYDSPREAGYDTPDQQAWRAWVRDRIALIVTAALIQAALMVSALLYAWLRF